MRASTLLTAAVWLGIAVAVYAALTGIVRSRQAQVLPVLTAPGELQVPRDADGHFHILGSINGVPVRFLVDTGASLVTVSESFARRAGLQGGTPIVFQTANGALSGRVVGGAHVEAGGLVDPRPGAQHLLPHRLADLRDPVALGPARRDGDRRCDRPRHAARAARWTRLRPLRSQVTSTGV